MTRLTPAVILALLTACDVEVVFPDDGSLDGTNAAAMGRGEVRPPRPTRGDFDRDGYTRADGDCDNRDPEVYPGAPDDQGDGVDNDCDGSADEDYTRADADGDGYTTREGDCDDTDAEVYPGAPDDQGDGIDNDCDGTADEDYTRADADGDGWTVADGDCDDSDPNVYPGAREMRDGVDNDCNGVIDG